MNKKAILRTTLTVLMIAAFACGTAGAASLKAKATNLKGDVKTRASATAAWQTVKAGDMLPEGSSVKCGPASEVFLGWGAGHVVKVGPLSTITLDNMTSDPAGSKNKLTVEEGKIFAKAGKMDKKSTFEVKTPTAVAGVRGTGFEATETSFSVVEGTVAVSAGGVEIDLAAGMMTEIPEIGAVPSEPAPIPPENLTELKATNEVTSTMSSEIQAGTTSAPAPTQEKDNSEEATKNALDTNDLNNLSNDANKAGTFEPGTGGIKGTIEY